MQLEISNAQKQEFEERIGEMAQEIQDLNEDRKIGEKKSQALMKDLKRQLLSEKQRNEKLSDKLDKLLAETSQNVLDPQQTSGKGGGVGSGETESEDARSTGSWSIYSDSPKNQPKAASNNSLSAAVVSLSTPTTSSSFVCSPAGGDASMGGSGDGDLAALLAKIEALQNDNFGLRTKSQMLEASAAAMADDLVRKSEIITHYCMEGKHVSVLKSQSTSFGSSSSLSGGGTTGSTEDQKSHSNQPNKLMKVMEQKAMSLKNSLNNNVNQERDMKQMQRCLEETLTKNMHLQKDLENMSLEVVRLSKLAPPPTSPSPSGSKD